MKFLRHQTLLKYKLILTILVLLSEQHIFAQAKIELLEYSPEKKYEQAFLDSLLYGHASDEYEVIWSSSTLKEVLENDPDLKGWMLYYLSEAVWAYRDREFEASVDWSNKALDHYKNLLNKRKVDEHLLIKAFNFRATALLALRRYSDALDDYFKALEMTERFTYKRKGYLLQGVARTYSEIGNDKDALEYYKKTEKDSFHMANDQQHVLLKFKIASIFGKQGDYNKAESYYKAALEKSLNGSYKRNLPSIYSGLGDIAFQRRELNRTAELYTQSVLAREQYLKGTGYIGLDANQLYNKSFLDFYHGNSVKAVESADSLVKELQKLKPVQKEDRKLFKMTKLLFDEYYEQFGNFKKWHAHNKVLDDLIEKSYENEIEINLQYAETKYQSKQKDASIAQLENINESQETILEQRNTINWVLGGLVLAIGVIAFLVFKQLQQRTQLRSVNLEQRLLRSQLNPHFLFNALNRVSSLANQQSDQTTSYVSRLGNLLRQILANSREEFITLAEEIETLSTYLQLQSDFSKKFDFEFMVDESLDREEVLIPPMFIQPFVENAIVHGFEGKEDEKVTITIEPHSLGKTLSISIINNGKPYSQSINKNDKSVNKSVSGQILKERLEIYTKMFKSKSYYTIKDVVEGERGSQVNLVLPLIRDL